MISGPLDRLVVASALLSLSSGALAGCSSDDSSASPPTVARTTSAATTSSAPSTAAPAPTRAGSSAALAGLDVPGGYAVTLRCRGTSADKDPVCGDPGKGIRWAVAQAWSGDPVPGGSGLRSMLVVNVIALTSDGRAAADAGAADARLQARDGSYDVPVRRRGDGYRPGERGTGAVEPVNRGAWTGTRLTERYVLVYDDGSRSGRIASSTYELRRGALRIEVTWSAGADGRAPGIDALVADLVQQLDQG